MSLRYQELDYQKTELGELILRVRQSRTAVDEPVYEVKLNGEFLMSSVVNQSEKALAERALAAWSGDQCDVLIGGLGLGCTAASAIEDPRVRRLDVVEYLQPVIDWHRNRWLPVSSQLIDDARVNLLNDNFFTYVGPDRGDRECPAYDLILVDIDHSPESWLDAANGEFYTEAGLRQMACRLRPGGVFGLWSADAVPSQFLHRLKNIFSAVQQHEIAYQNPFFHRVDDNVVVVATNPRHPLTSGEDSSKST